MTASHVTWLFCKRDLCFVCDMTASHVTWLFCKRDLCFVTHVWMLHFTSHLDSKASRKVNNTVCCIASRKVNNTVCCIASRKVKQTLCAGSSTHTHTHTHTQCALEYASASACVWPNSAPFWGLLKWYPSHTVEKISTFGGLLRSCVLWKECRLIS